MHEIKRGVGYTTCNYRNFFQCIVEHEISQSKNVTTTQFGFKKSSRSKLDLSVLTSSKEVRHRGLRTLTL